MNAPPNTLPQAPEKNSAFRRFIGAEEGGTPNPAQTVEPVVTPIQPRTRPVEQTPAPQAESKEEVQTTSIFNTDKEVEQTPKDEFDPDSQVTTETSDEEIEAQAKNESVRENYRRLAKANREVKKTKKTLEAKLAEAEDKLSKYDSGEIQPDLLIELKGEVDRLRPMEALINFRASKEAKDKYDHPMADKVATIKNYAKHYGIPEAHIDTYVNDLLTAPEHKRNQVISTDYDRVTGDKIENLVTQVVALRNEKAEAEKNAESSLTGLVQEREARELEESNKFIDRTAHEVSNHFTAVLQSIKTENKIPELILGADDKFNQDVVIPLHQQSSKDYGQLMRALVSEGGIKKIPKAAAEVIARMMLGYHFGMLSLGSREAAETAANKMYEDSQTRLPVIRPPMAKRVQNPSPSGNGTQQNGKPSSLASRVTGTLDAIQGRK